MFDRVTASVLSHPTSDNLADAQERIDIWKNQSDAPVDVYIDHLQLSNEHCLLDRRVECPSCKRMQKHFCPFCIRVLPGNKLPSVQLPFEVVVIHHVKEPLQKSSAIHAAILAPDNVTIVEFDPQLTPGDGMLDGKKLGGKAKAQPTAASSAQSESCAPAVAIPEPVGVLPDWDPASTVCHPIDVLPSAPSCRVSHCF
jgi:hypothetical protein